MAYLDMIIERLEREIGSFCLPSAFPPNVQMRESIWSLRSFSPDCPILNPLPMRMWQSLRS